MRLFPLRPDRLPVSCSFEGGIKGGVSELIIIILITV